MAGGGLDLPYSCLFVAGCNNEVSFPGATDVAFCLKQSSELVDTLRMQPAFLSTGAEGSDLPYSFQLTAVACV